MTRDRTLAVVVASFVVLAIVGPWLPQWAMFIVTIAFARGLVGLGLLLLRVGLRGVLVVGGWSRRGRRLAGRQGTDSTTSSTVLSLRSVFSS